MQPVKSQFTRSFHTPPPCPFMPNKIAWGCSSSRSQYTCNFKHVRTRMYCHPGTSVRPCWLANLLLLLLLLLLFIILLLILLLSCILVVEILDNYGTCLRNKWDTAPTLNSTAEISELLEPTANYGAQYVEAMAKAQMVDVSFRPGYNVLQHSKDHNIQVHASRNHTMPVEVEVCLVFS